MTSRLEALSGFGRMTFVTFVPTYDGLAHQVDGSYGSDTSKECIWVKIAFTYWGIEDVGLLKGESYAARREPMPAFDR
jgi:hypothetical protein